MENATAAKSPEISPGYAEYRADLAHYWARLMWYRDELWRVTTPVWGVYGAFIASCVGYVWSSKENTITGEIAGMLMVVIIAFSWVIQRMYWTYAHRIYKAINELNSEVQRREQHLYTDILHNKWQADYGRYRVYPELNVIFSIVGVAMMLACIFTVGASVRFSFQPPPASNADNPFAIDMRLVIELCFALLVIFELVLHKFKKYCEVCGDEVGVRPSGKVLGAAPAEQPRS